MHTLFIFLKSTSVLFLTLSMHLSLSNQKFTGHATPITQLLFLPSPSSPDSNGNVVVDSLVSGQYLLSGAEQDRLLNVW